MNNDHLKTLLSRFDKNSFQAFCFDLLKSSYEELLTELPDIDKGIFEYYRPSSFRSPEIFTYITHYFPIELFKDKNIIDVIDTELPRKIDNFVKRYDFGRAYRGPTIPIEYGDHTFYILNNFSEIEEDYVQDILLPKYKNIMQSFGINQRVGIGTYDTFVDNSAVLVNEVLMNFMKDYSDGIKITLSSDKFEVNKYQIEKPIFSGITNDICTPLEPCYIIENRSNIFIEFEKLLNEDTKESHLEEFLRENFRIFFGPQYDRIETQMWLRTPHLDINNKNRRLDIFLRNCIQNDWELFELKRTVKLTKTVNGDPNLANQVHVAVQQIKNYQRILLQKEVQESLKAKGIEYFEPELNLIIGRDPQIDHAHWRYLRNTYKGQVKIATYDEQLKEAKVRFDFRNLYK